MNEKVEELLSLIDVDQKVSKQAKFANTRQDSSLKISSILVDSKSPFRVEHYSTAQYLVERQKVIGKLVETSQEYFSSFAPVVNYSTSFAQMLAEFGALEAKRDPAKGEAIVKISEFFQVFKALLQSLSVDMGVCAKNLMTVVNTDNPSELLPAAEKIVKSFESAKIKSKTKEFDIARHRATLQLKMCGLVGRTYDICQAQDVGFFRGLLDVTNVQRKFAHNAQKSLDDVSRYITSVHDAIAKAERDYLTRRKKLEATNASLKETLEEIDAQAGVSKQEKKTKKSKGKQDDAQHAAELEEFVSQIKMIEGNDACCDCGGVTTHVSTNLGILLCSDCASVHNSELHRHLKMGCMSLVRELKGEKVASLPWQSDLLLVRAIGNKVANSVLEHSILTLPSFKHQKLTSKTPFKQRKKYIVGKYANREYILPKHEIITPALDAVQKKDFKALLFLLAWGSISPSSKDAKALVFEAVRGNHILALEFLLQNGFDPNVVSEDGSYPLHVAASADHAQCVKLLIRHSANVDVRNGHGLTPLEICGQDTEACDALRDLGYTSYIDVPWTDDDLDTSAISMHRLGKSKDDLLASTMGSVDNLLETEGRPKSRRPAPPPPGGKSRSADDLLSNEGTLISYSSSVPPTDVSEDSVHVVQSSKLPLKNDFSVLIHSELSQALGQRKPGGPASSMDSPTTTTAPPPVPAPRRPTASNMDGPHGSDGGNTPPGGSPSPGTPSRGPVPVKRSNTVPDNSPQSTPPPHHVPLAGDPKPAVSPPLVPPPTLPPVHHASHPHHHHSHPAPSPPLTSIPSKSLKTLGPAPPPPPPPSHSESDTDHAIYSLPHTTQKITATEILKTGPNQGSPSSSPASSVDDPIYSEIPNQVPGTRPSPLSTPTKPMSSSPQPPFEPVYSMPASISTKPANPTPLARGESVPIVNPTLPPPPPPTSAPRRPSVDSLGAKDVISTQLSEPLVVAIPPVTPGPTIAPPRIPPLLTSTKSIHDDDDEPPMGMPPPPPVPPTILGSGSLGQPPVEVAALLKPQPPQPVARDRSLSTGPLLPPPPPPPGGGPPPGPPTSNPPPRAFPSNPPAVAPKRSFDLQANSPNASPRFDRKVSGPPGPPPVLPRPTASSTPPDFYPPPPPPADSNLNDELPPPPPPADFDLPPPPPSLMSSHADNDDDFMPPPPPPPPPAEDC